MGRNNWHAQGVTSQEDISSLINIPLPMDYYNLVDAVRLAKLKFKISNCSAKLLVYYATKQSINLFTPVQNSLEFTLVDTRADGSLIPFPVKNQPYHIHFLVLSLAACLDFVSNGKTKQRKFPAAYTYNNCKLELIHNVSNWGWQIVSDHLSTPHPMDAAKEGQKNASVQNLEADVVRDSDSKSSPLDQRLERNDGSKSTKGVERDPKAIALSDSNILISHDSLYGLIRVIKDEIKRNEANNQLQNPQKYINSEPGNASPSACYSLTFAASKAPDCQPLDLLRRAIQRNIVLLVLVPENVDVRSTNSFDNTNENEFQWKPHFLALNKADCKQIWINQVCEKNNVFQYEFTEGYIINNSGHMQKALPTSKRPWSANERITWRTFYGLAIWNLELTSENLYVMHSDLGKLTVPDPHDFDIPLRTNEFLLSYDYIPLAKAVKLVILDHPECTPNHLLLFGKSKILEFITPVPAGIKLHKDRCHNNSDDNSQPTKDAPELLALSWFDCEKIARYGSAKLNCFSKGYSIGTGQLKIEYATDTRENWWWLSYYQDKQHEIEITPDRLFVTLSNLFQIINAEQSQWDLIENLIKENEAQKLALTETLTDESSNADTKANLAPIEKITKSNVAGDQSVADLIEGDSESSLDKIRLDEVIAIVGFKKRKIYSLIKTNAFPKQEKIDSVAYWRKSEILAWFEENKFEPVITGKRKPKAIIAVEKVPVPSEGRPPEVSKLPGSGSGMD